MLCEKSYMVVGAKVCELTDGFLLFFFVCGLYVGILTSPVGDINIYGSPQLICNQWSDSA